MASFNDFREHIRFSLDKAAEMIRIYKSRSTNPEYFPRSVNDFHILCEEYLEHKIVLKRPKGRKGGTVLAAFLSYPTEDRIGLVSEDDYNFCRDRFIRCKELFHAITNLSQYRNMDIFKHVQNMVVPTPGRPGTLPPLSSISEQMAEIAAGEFLFPYTERLKHGSSIKTLDEYKAIAEKYKAPRVYVEMFLSSEWMLYISTYQ